MDPDVITRAEQAFQHAFGGTAAHLVQAPGRVNLIGEHTDYNDGFVLPCAIDFGCVVAARARPDSRVRVVAADFGETLDEFELGAPLARRDDVPWANYVRGVVQQLLRAGVALRGAELAIAGNVPQGAGLSSSAALEVAVAQAFKTLLGPDLQALSPTAMALVAQAAENEFVGCRCGIMDQLVSARGEAGHALLIDCRSLDVRAVPVPDSAAVLIAHSHVQRGLVGSEYNTRRSQCEAAARHFGLAALRDLTLERLRDEGEGLDEVVRRRARHVVSENRRVLDFADALAAGDLGAAGRLMAQSHESMRDDFEITVPAVDRLVEILQRAIGAQGGARMTGGGFGGCAVALLRRSALPGVVDAVARDYRSPDGRPSTVWVCRPSAGASTLR